MVASQFGNAARGFVFAPRKLGEQQAQIGNTSMALLSAKGTGTEDPRWRAAQLQHLVANAVRESLAAKGTNLSSWVRQQHSDSGGVNYDRLVRIQRGETMMQLADLFYWVAKFAGVAELLASHPFASATGDGPPQLATTVK